MGPRVGGGKLAAGTSPREPYDDAAARNEAGADGGDHLGESPAPASSSAFERDFATIKEGCDAILRAIREVDEAALPTVPPPKPRRARRPSYRWKGRASLVQRLEGAARRRRESRRDQATHDGFFIFSQEQRAC